MSLRGALQGLKPPTAADENEDEEDSKQAATLVDDEATLAADTTDGNRAWVIRDALIKIDPKLAGAIRTRLDGIRRKTGAASTSRATETATRFSDLPLGQPLAEPPTDLLRRPSA